MWNRWFSIKLRWLQNKFLKMSSRNFANFLDKFGVVLLVTCAPSWAIPLTSILALEKFLFSTHFTEIYILIRWSRWGPLVTRLPSHQKNAPLIYYMIPKIHCVWCDHVRFGLVVFSNHTAIITRRAMMAAKFLNFEAYGNAYVDRQKQNLHNKESF